MYFPQSQLKTDLYTNGGELQLSNNGTEYIGPYFIAQGNQYYSGRNPNDRPISLLTPLKTNLSIVNDFPSSENLPNSYYVTNDQYYHAINKSTTSAPRPPSTPTQIYSIPTKKDYEITEFQRYFVKRVNEVRYIEISQQEFTKYLNKEENVSWQLYTPFSIPWEIAGDRSKVYKVNKATVERTQSNLQLVGLTSYFKNKYNQYYK
tara:strand:+ start:7609 stop:8223 length:615 start_codon:yes stop_codon:yes gene_type:complete